MPDLDQSDEASSPDFGETRYPDLPRSVLDNLIEGCQVVDREFRYLYVNEAVAQHGRTTRRALQGRKMSECYPGIERTEMFAVLRGVMSSRHPAQMENEFEYPDGSKGCFELRLQPVPEGVAILSVDITERKRNELGIQHALRALRTLSGCNQALVRATTEVSFMQEVCDLLVNDGGYADARIEIVHPAHVSVRAQNPASAQDDAAETMTFQLEVGSRPTGVLSIVRERDYVFGALERDLLDEIALDLAHGITTLRDREKHKEALAQLASARRLTSVERLASGVAHDFNNFLSVMLAYSTTALESLEDGETEHVQNDLERVVEAGKKAAALTRKLLAVGRQQQMEPAVVEPAEFLQELKDMVDGLLPDKVELSLSVDPAVEKIRVDPDLLERALMNLVINARDAMPNGGRLIIDVANAEREGDPRWVRFSVRDTGLGMTDDVRHQVFEPFFTTKSGSHGTGLGLATVHGIITQSGGAIDVSSHVGEGSKFDLFLPCAH